MFSGSHESKRLVSSVSHFYGESVRIPEHVHVGGKMKLIYFTTYPSVVADLFGISISFIRSRIYFITPINVSNCLHISLYEQFKINLCLHQGPAYIVLPCWRCVIYGPHRRHVRRYTSSYVSDPLSHKIPSVVMATDKFSRFNIFHEAMIFDVSLNLKK